MIEGDMRSGGGEGSVFCFFLLIEEKRYLHIYTHMKESCYVGSRLFPSSSEPPYFLKYWANVQKSLRHTVPLFCKRSGK